MAIGPRFVEGVVLGIGLDTTGPWIVGGAGRGLEDLVEMLALAGTAVLTPSVVTVDAEVVDPPDDGAFASGFALPMEFRFHAA